MPPPFETSVRETPFWRDRWVLGGLFVFVAFRLVYFLDVASSMSPFGDEAFYYRNASVVVHLVQCLGRGDISAAAALAPQLVDRGWFLPGMSVVTAPVRALTDSVPLARVYIAALNSLLFWLAASRLARSYGIIPARIAIGFVAIFPYHAAFSFTFWGDLVAGHGLVLLLVMLADIQKDIEGTEGMARTRWLLVGVITLGLVYVRPSLTLLVPSSILFLFLFHLQVLKWRQALWRSVVAGAGIATIVAAGLLPWSYSVSKRFGGLVVTTTSIDINIIYAFGPGTWRPHIAAGDNPWSFIFDVVQRKAGARGASFALVAREWRREVIDSLTRASYAAAVRDNLRLFFLEEGDFLERFASPDFRRRGKARDFDAFTRVSIVLNGVLWRVALLFSVVALLLPWRLVGPGWWLGLLFRVAFCGVAAQPFLSDSNGRSYIMLVPLIAMALGVAPLAIALARQRYRAARPRQNERLFRCVEWAMPSAIAVILTAISF